MSYALPDNVCMQHIPKTGGTWCKQALRAAGIAPQRFRSQHMWERPPGTRFTFVFVRDPVDWLRSWWRYNEAREWSGFPAHWRGRADAPTRPFWEIGIRTKTFHEFVDAYLEQMPGQICREFARYTSRSDFIGRTENLRADLVRALDLAGLTYDPEPIWTMTPKNVSTGPEVEYRYDQIERIYEVETDFHAIKLHD